MEWRGKGWRKEEEDVREIQKGSRKHKGGVGSDKGGSEVGGWELKGGSMERL